MEEYPIEKTPGEGEQEAAYDDSPPESQAEDVSSKERDIPEDYGPHPSGETDGTGGNAAAKASTINRVIARFIDILVALLLGRLPGLIGLFSALTYICIADGLMGGRSIGKRIIGLRVSNPGKGRVSDFRDSILRNSTIGILYVISRVPILGGIVAAIGLGMELVLIVGSPEGKRLGDEIAGTIVTEYRQEYI
jgi:uncharacterized RDD family membrane protein YckC